MIVAKDKIEEMLAGLEGVTPGPWKSAASVEYDCYGIYPDTGFTEFPIAKMPEYKLTQIVQADAAHIARCDPDTMRSILTDYLRLREAEETP